MCLPLAGAAGIAGAQLAISAVSTVASIGLGIAQASQQAAAANAQLQAQAQAQRNQLELSRQQMEMQQQQQRSQQIQSQRAQAQQYNLQVTQNNASLLQQQQQQNQQVLNERESIMSRFSADKIGYQRSKEQYQEQVRNNNEAANRVYMAEQSKITEARKKAAFENQASLAKAIGAKGAILAAGRTGQSIGLLVGDVERQQGFEQAQTQATIENAQVMVGVGMDTALNQASSANNQALGNVAFNPATPYLPKFMDTPAFVDGNAFTINRRNVSDDYYLS